MRNLNGNSNLSLAINELKHNGLEPSRLTIEATGRAYTEHMEQAKQTLERFRESGVTSDLEDFGTVFSSLGYHEHLHVDTPRIDKNFIVNCPEKSDGAIITAIIEMPHALELKVVAEGVETEKQLKFPHRAGCDGAQGFYFSPAVRGEELLESLLVQGV